MDTKFKYLDNDNTRRRKIAKYYRENIKNAAVILPETYDENAHVWHIFAIRTKERDRLQNYLRENGIETLIHYPIPPHKQECYKEWNHLSFPITEEIHNTILSIPISPIMNNEEVVKVVRVINEYIA